MSTLHNSGRLTRRTIAILTATVVTATLTAVAFFIIFASDGAAAFSVSCNNNN